MPSRQAPSAAGEGGRVRHMVLAIVAGGLVLLFLSLLVYVVRKLICKRTATAPSELKVSVPRRFKYSVLRRATTSFSNRLGKGGVGSVYGGVLENGRSVAVKVMDSGSLQGEREFRNEILLAGRIGESERVLSILGFVEERRRRKELVLLYDLMTNGSLQDALLHRKCVELMDWKVRFRIALDVADGIYFLHFVCDPPVIHCDIKPSNVLLDCDFRAKLADFGLASVRCGKGYYQAVDLAEDGMIADEKIEDEDCKNGSVGDGNQFAGSGVEDGACCSGLDGNLSPNSLCGDADLEMSLPLKVFEKKGNGDGTESGIEKVFPIDRSSSEAVDASSAVGAKNPGWGSYDEFDIHVNEKHQKLPREWWKEEFFTELTNKSRKKRGLMALGVVDGVELCCRSDGDGATAAKKTRTFINGCYHKLSFDILKKQSSNQDWAYKDTPKSHCAASTPSMKGTVCYTAPEFSCVGNLSEKCDVYSFGVLLLVLISGRRPLEMTSTLMLDFEKANLVSWARQLALEDKLLDLVDPNVKSLDKEQALRCLTVALLCLQRSPANRPSAKEIVQMLSDCSYPPYSPLEFSLSPPQIIPR